MEALELTAQIQILTLLLWSCVILDKFLESLCLTGTKVYTVASYPFPRDGTSFFSLIPFHSGAGEGLDLNMTFYFPEAFWVGGSICSLTGRDRVCVGEIGDTALDGGYRQEVQK